MKNFLTKKIHFSGFTKLDKEDLIQKSKNLGLKINDELTGKTDFLVCKSILVEKFRIAKILNISVAKSLWIQDSTKAGTLLDPLDYQFSIFEDLKFFLLGFEKKQAIQVAKEIVNCKGELFMFRGRQIPF